MNKFESEAHREVAGVLRRLAKEYEDRASRGLQHRYTLPKLAVELREMAQVISLSEVEFEAAMAKAEEAIEAAIARLEEAHDGRVEEQAATEAVGVGAEVSAQAATS